MENSLQTFDEEIVDHPLMNAFIEWDNDKTDYRDQTALALAWKEFLHWRPDLNPAHDLYCRMCAQPPIMRMRG